MTVKIGSIESLTAPGTASEKVLKPRNALTEMSSTAEQTPPSLLQPKYLWIRRPSFLKETLSQDAVVSRGMHHTRANHRQNFAVHGHGLAQLKLNQIMNKNRPASIS